MTESSGQPVKTEAAFDPQAELVHNIEVEMEQISSSILAQTQPGEVARSFLCRARGLAREGKLTLAKRQREAARNVLSGCTRDESGLEGEDGAR